jgi:hypothetical protein
VIASEPPAATGRVDPARFNPWAEPTPTPVGPIAGV